MYAVSIKMHTVSIRMYAVSIMMHVAGIRMCVVGIGQVGVYREGSIIVADMLYVADGYLRKGSSDSIYTPSG